MRDTLDVGAPDGEVRDNSDHGTGEKSDENLVVEWESALLSATPEWLQIVDRHDDGRDVVRVLV